MTPSGTRTRSIRMPFGRRHAAKTVPTGSLSLRMTSRPAAAAAMRSASSVSRSRKAGVAPADFASATSSALAARIAGCARRMALAMAASASFFCAAGASARVRAARRAARPISRMVASSLSVLSIALSGAFMTLIRLAFSASYHVPRSPARRAAVPVVHSHPRRLQCYRQIAGTGCKRTAFRL